VLAFDPSKTLDEFEAKYYTAVKNTMILMMLADGVIDDSELSMIGSVYKEVTGKPISEADIRQQAEELQASGTTIHGFLGEMGSLLNDPGREMVVEAAFMVAMADGDFDESERELLAEIAASMHMTPAHVNGVIDGLLSGLSAPAQNDGAQPPEADGSW